MGREHKVAMFLKGLQSAAQLQAACLSVQTCSESCFFYIKAHFVQLIIDILKCEMQSWIDAVDS